MKQITLDFASCFHCGYEPVGVKHYPWEQALIGDQPERFCTYVCAEQEQNRRSK